MSDDLRAAVAAGVVGSEESFRSLLQSVVEVARAIFGAKASSIFLLDEEADELVFEAVAGEGAETLLGQRFPSSTGIAGWVLVTRQPLVIEDVTEDPALREGRRREHRATCPKGLMAVPLLHEERALGVLEVLDRPAAHAVLARRDGSARAVREPGGDRARPPAARAEGRGRARGERGGRGGRRPPRRDGRALEDERREAGLKLLGALEEVLRTRRGRLLAALVTKLFRRDQSGVDVGLFAQA